MQSQRNLTASAATSRADTTSAAATSTPCCNIMVAETAGEPLTLAQPQQRMDVSSAAITYLVDRMIDAGHIRREPDPEDRLKSLLRYEKPGMELAR